MEQKNSQTFKIDKKYHKDILSFVKLNEIEDVDVFVNKCFKKGFDTQRFGLLGGETEIKEIEVEKIVEKIIEVPVEKIVEIIKEVPSPPIEIEVIKYVEKEVVKEVPVEKIVEKIEYIYDKTPTELDEKIFHLEQELLTEKRNFSTKMTEMEKIFENEMSKKDSELDIFRQKLDIPVNENKVKMLENTLQNLRKELQFKITKINELEDKVKNFEEQLSKKINAIYMKGSNLNENI
jgi:hypothetical protein